MSTLIDWKDHTPLIPIIVFMGTAFLIPLLVRKARKLSWLWALAAHAIALPFVRLLDKMVQAEGAVTYALGNWPAPWGIELYVDGFSVLVLYVLLVVSALIVIYSGLSLVRDLKDEVLPWYYNLYLLLIMSMLGLSVTNDLFNMFVFMEIGTIGACGIIALKKDADCIESSLKYLLMSSIGTSFILMATAIIYNVSGHLNLTFASLSLTAFAALYPFNISIAAVFFAIGFFIKSALFPLHIWLPDAHTSAPSASSGALSGLVIKIYAVTFLKLVRFLFPAAVLAVIPLQQIVVVLACMSMLFGSILALRQTEIKRILAYSSIAQIGLVFLGIGIYNADGIAGSLYQIGAHASAKALLFLTVGIFYYHRGVKERNDLAGLGQHYPLATAGFIVGAITMIGLPTSGGFISKIYLAVGALAIGQPLIVAVILLSTVLTGLYFFPLIALLLFGKSDRPIQARDKSTLMDVAVGLLLVISVAAGIAPDLFAGLLELGVKSIM
jgi:multicomponent Na+:H+ antiporter subunit D